MKVLTEKEFQKFNNDTRRVWQKKLLNEYGKQRIMVEAELGTLLEYPTFKVLPLDRLWGQWSPAERTITLNEDLFKHYPWDAVIHVLKHEMAHQVVTEILDMDVYGVSHGEAWELACAALRVEPKRCVSYSFLQEYETSVYDKMTSKIEKLLALGESSFEEEAQSAIAKAYELMERYKIKLAKKKRKGKVWISRPVGILFKKMPSYVWELTRMMSDYYNVRCIQCHHYDNEDGHNGSYRYIEMFGEPHNLDVAEYVFHFLLVESEYRWKKFYKSEEYMSGVHGKVAWINEFMRGFGHKLAEQKRVIFEAQLKEDKENSEAHSKEEEKTEAYQTCTSLIYQYDKVLEERYKENYPNMRSCKTGGGSRRSGNGGFGAGQDTRVRSAVRKGTSTRRRQLGA